MSMQPDLVVYSRNDEPRLVVEVKGRQGVSESWASRFRANLVRHGFSPGAPFFMLVFPDQLLLWKNAPEDPEAPPYIRAETEEVLKPFLDALPAGGFDEPSLELAVQAWINILTRLGLDRDDIGHHHPWLLETGLLDAVRGGHVKLPSAA